MVIPLTHHSFAPKPSLNCEHSLTASSGEYGGGLRPETHYLRHFNCCVKYITIYFYLDNITAAVSIPNTAADVIL